MTGQNLGQYYFTALPTLDWIFEGLTTDNDGNTTGYAMVRVPHTIRVWPSLYSTPDASLLEILWKRLENVPLITAERDAWGNLIFDASGSPKEVSLYEVNPGILAFKYDTPVKNAPRLVQDKCNQGDYDGGIELFIRMEMGKVDVNGHPIVNPIPGSVLALGVYEIKKVTLGGSEEQSRWIMVEQEFYVVYGTKLYPIKPSDGMPTEITADRDIVHVERFDLH